jgi:hypothetical protein
MTRKLTETELSNLSRALGIAMRRWKLVSGAEHLVFEFPLRDGRPSPADGEPAKFWRFDDKRKAEEFRDRKVMESITTALLNNGVVG